MVQESRRYRPKVLRDARYVARLPTLDGPPGSGDRMRALIVCTRLRFPALDRTGAKSPCGLGGERYMHITVQVRSVYGNDLVYPADDAALLFARLVGAKTFNAAQLGTIRALGYAVHVAAGTLPQGF
jgi:hypothetical protein